MKQISEFEDSLRKYIDTKFPIIYIRTDEEEKTDRYIASAAGRREIREWNGADGYVYFKTKVPIGGTRGQSLEKTLTTLNIDRKELDRKLLIIKDATEQLKQDGQYGSDNVIALLKKIALKIYNGIIDASVIIISSTLHIPHELEKLTTVLKLDFPREEEIGEIIDQVAEENGISAIPKGFRSELATAFKGMSESEIKGLLNLAIYEDEGFTKKTLQLISEQKRQIILKAGILEMIPLKERIEDIGGLDKLKEWLERKAKVFKNMKEAEEFGVAMPKGVLIAGLPGCGKSLSAKAVGTLFNVPLLRLDMGRLMGKYVGESEENMRKAIRLAEAISPCVLWVDELEKAFAGIESGGGGSEVTTRLFGAFLTWMQEKKSATFVVATANKIAQLPPEFLRKGRFDEIFYVDLPNKEERRKIFEIHLKKRRKADALKIDIERLADNTDGYSGADIESVVSESVENAFVMGSGGLTTEDVLNCIKDTHPLSETMKDELEEMSKEYKKRNFKKASKEANE